MIRSYGSSPNLLFIEEELRQLIRKYIKHHIGKVEFDLGVLILIVKPLLFVLFQLTDHEHTKTDLTQAVPSIVFMLKHWRWCS